MYKSQSAVTRYGFPLLSVLAAYLLRIFLERFTGPGLPTYVTFYPVIMFVAVISGLGPGLLATFSAAVTAYYFLLTPQGEFGMTSPAEAVGLVIFVTMGTFMTVVASYHLQLRNRLHVMVEERTAALSQVNAQLMATNAELHQHAEELTRSNVELKKAEEEVRLSEERFRTMFAHHQAIMLLIDPQSGAIIDANRSATIFYGFSHAELTRMNIQEINQLADEQVVAERGLAATEKKSHFIFPHRLADGRIRWVEVYSSPVAIRGSRLLFSIIHDITERKQLDAERQKFVSLAENSTEFIAMCDMNLVPFYVNKNGLEQIGLDTLEQALRMSVYDLFFPEDQRFIREDFFPRVLENGQGEVEIRYRHVKTGEPVWMIFNVFHIRDTEGNPVGLATVSRNVTERKRYENKLRESHEAAFKLMNETFAHQRQTEEAHEALRRSEELLRFHTDNSPMAVIEWDADFIVTRWTGEAEHMFGWKEAETIGKSISELKMIYEEDIPIVESTVRRLNNAVSRKVVACNRNYTKSGEVIYCTWHNTILLNDEGRVSSVMSLVQNVTEQTLAEIEIARLNQNLQRSLDELQAILQTVPIGLAIAEDPQGLRIRGNTANERLLGLPRGSNLSLAQEPPPYRAFMNDLELDLLKLPMQRAVRGESVAGEIIKIQRQDGANALLFCNAVPLYDEEGASRGAVGAFLDISELKRSEERTKLLAETAARLLITVSPQEEIEALCHKALHVLDCHVFFNYLVDITTGQLHLNAAAGIPEEEKEKIVRLDYGVAVCGCAARDACRIVAEDIPNSADDHTALVASFDIKAYACHPLITADEVLGTLSFGSRSRTSFSEEDLELMKAIADLVAIAIERDKDRSKLEIAHTMLEKQVLERTGELQTALKALEGEMNERLQAVEELRQKERMLSQQSRLAAMGEMISNIAHQWRQPLNTLGLLIQRLPVFYDDRDIFNRAFVVDTTNDAMKLIQHMSATIDDFRDFFKPEKEPTLFSVERAIHQAIALVDVSFRSHNIRIEVHADDNPFVNGFPNEFAQVIMNIIVNARDALHEKSVGAGIIVIRTGHENNRVFISISDNGGGIPEAIIDRIFEPYFTTKEPDRGTGIGLFMAKTIIEQNHGGRLIARNCHDGAEFRIEI